MYPARVSAYLVHGLIALLATLASAISDSLRLGHQNYLGVK
jgi:hypothetical protein